MSETTIEARNLTKSFGKEVVAIKDLDFEVKRGSVFGLIGRNASGKTTALRLLLGLLQPDNGDSRILGWNFWKAPRQVRSRVAYVCQGGHLPESFSLEQMSWCMRRVNENWDPELARRMAQRWDLPWERALGCLSSGRQRLAATLIAVAVRPEVLILDEPAAGLDPVARRELMEQVVEMLTRTDGCTVLLCTHLISDLERLADHVGIIDRGRMALSMSVEVMMSQVKRVQVVFEEKEAPAGFQVPGLLLPLRRMGPVASGIVRWTHEGEIEALQASTKARVQVFSMGMEEIFVELFGNASHERSENLLPLKDLN